MIGLEETEVQVPEDITDGVRLLCAKVFRRRNLHVKPQSWFNTMTRTAIGKYVTDKIRIILYLILSPSIKFC